MYDQPTYIFLKVNEPVNILFYKLLKKILERGYFIAADEASESKLDSHRNMNIFIDYTVWIEFIKFR